MPSVELEYAELLATVDVVEWLMRTQRIAIRDPYQTAVQVRRWDPRTPGSFPVEWIEVRVLGGPQSFNVFMVMGGLQYGRHRPRDPSMGFMTPAYSNRWAQVFLDDPNARMLKNASMPYPASLGEFIALADFCRFLGRHPSLIPFSQRMLDSTLLVVFPPERMLFEDAFDNAMDVEAEEVVVRNGRANADRFIWVSGGRARRLPLHVGVQPVFRSADGRFAFFRFEDAQPLDED